MQVEYLDLHLQRQPPRGAPEASSIAECVQVDKKHDSLKRDLGDRAKKQPRTGEVKTFELADETDRKALKPGSLSQALDLSGFGSSLAKGLVLHRTDQHVQVSVFEPRDASPASTRNNFFRDASDNQLRSRHKHTRPAPHEAPALRSGDRSGHFGSSRPGEKTDRPDRDPGTGKPGLSRSALKLADLQKKLDSELNTKLKISHVLRLAIQKFALPPEAPDRAQDALQAPGSRLLPEKDFSPLHRLTALLAKNKKSAAKIVFLLMARKLRDRKKEALRKVYKRSLRKRR